MVTRDTRAPARGTTFWEEAGNNAIPSTNNAGVESAFLLIGCFVLIGRVEWCAAPEQEHPNRSKAEQDFLQLSVI